MQNVATVGIAADVIIAALLLINVILGCRRGLIKTVFHGCAALISAGAAYFFSKPLAALLKTTPFYHNVIGGLEQVLNDAFARASGGLSGDPISAALSGENAELAALFEKFGTNLSDVTAEYARLSEHASEEASALLMRSIAEPVCSAILTALSFAVIFIAALLILKLLMHLLDFVAKAPVLKSVNRVGGLAAGILIALLQIFIFIMLLDALVPLLSGADAGFTRETLRSETVLYGFFASFNPLVFILAAVGS